MASKLTLNMGDAAYAASLADGVTKNGRKQTSSDKVSLRRGKWTPEEEHFALRLIEEFKAGLLPLTDGTTLRTFLSKLLNCDPMRISKKFVGDNCIGKVRTLLMLPIKSLSCCRLLSFTSKYFGMPQPERWVGSLVLSEWIRASVS